MIDNFFFDKIDEYKVQSVSVVSPSLRRDRRNRETEKKKTDKKKKDENIFELTDPGDGTKCTFNYVV